MGLRFSDLERTLSTFFRIGTIRIKDVAGVVHLRNAADSGFVDGIMARTKIMGTNSANGVILAAPGSMSNNLTLTLPPADGATGQMLGTNGAGTLGWFDATAGAPKVDEEAFTQATASPLAIFTPAAGEVIVQAEIEITVNGAGGAPTLALGISTLTGAIVATTEVDLLEIGTYIKLPYYICTGVPIIATIVASGQTFSGKIRITHATPQ